MSRRQFSSSWYTGVVVSSAIVAVVAGLLLAIIATARSILAQAHRALDAAQRIVTHTRAIWMLEETSQTATHLLSEAQAIQHSTAEIATALEPAQDRRAGKERS